MAVIYEVLIVVLMLSDKEYIGLSWGPYSGEGST
jgi:hypothetical protein